MRVNTRSFPREETYALSTRYPLTQYNLEVKEKNRRNYNRDKLQEEKKKWRQSNKKYKSKKDMWRGWGMDLCKCRSGREWKPKSSE